MTNFSGEHLNSSACVAGPQGERRESASSKYQAYPEYKDSGMEWLKQIPKHWVEKKIKWEITVSSGVDQKNDDGVFDLYGANGIIGKSNSSVINHKHGVVLVGRVGSAGAINFVQDVCAVSDNALIVKNNTFDVVRFDFYLLLSLNLEELVSKNAQPLITASNMREIIAAVPSDAVERMKIASFLDHETAKIDTLIEQQQQLIQLLKEKRQAVISHAVTKGLSSLNGGPNAPMKDSGVEWLGEVPEHWVVKRLKHISPKIGVGLVINPSTYTKDEGVYFIFGGDVKEYGFDLSNTRRIAPEDSNKLLPSRLNHRDLISVRVGYPGITAVVTEDLEGANCASVIVIRKGKYNSDWLCASMNSWVGRQQVELVSYGAAQKQFNVADAIDFIFPVPPYEEQNEIASYVEKALNRFDMLSKKADNQIDLLQERRTALISAAVTGKIDVRHFVPEAGQAPQN